MNNNKTVFSGVVEKNKISYLIFSNSIGTVVEIPVDKKVADHILIYLQTISFPNEKIVEPSEEDDFQSYERK